MRLAIMQPYFFPYLGYFQLMSAVDEFVIYDNIQFTKKGWINRNRVLVNGQPSYITVPLKNESDFLDVRDRHLADLWPGHRRKLLNRIAEAYRKAPCFDCVFPLIEQALGSQNVNLFEFLVQGLCLIREALSISTPIVVSSSIPIDHTLKGKHRVMEICKARRADVYVNPIGGVDLYTRDEFAGAGLDLRFLKMADFEYPQFGGAFVPYLSIIDVMMFNSRERIAGYLTERYELR